MKLKRPLSYKITMDKKLLDLIKAFVHLHNHSEYSNIRLLDSINKFENMITHANSLGQNGLALTDHECLSGHVKFLKAVKELKSKNKIREDFKPILGNEIYLVDEFEMYEEIDTFNSTTFYHFLLLAKDTEGHHQLRELSSRAWKRMFSYKGMERVPTFYTDFEEIVGVDKGHLIASTACLGGLFPRLVAKLIHETDEDAIEAIKDKIHNFICWCIDMFGEDDFYIEIQPTPQVEQEEFNIKAIQIAKAYGLKWVVTTDAHYLRSSDRLVHSAYLTSDEDDNGNREVDDFYMSTHFFSVYQLFKSMKYIGKEDLSLAIFNTKEIRNKIEEYHLFKPTVIPLIKLPDKKDWYNIKFDMDNIPYKYIKELYESDEIQHRYLIHQVFRGIEEREVTQEKLPAVLDRINTECYEIIGASKAKKQPMGAYLVTMQKNVDIIWDEAESFVGAGRGSANGYIINYLLGITQVNPLEQGVEMPHWRFMSAQRPDVFDIDIDYSSHKRDTVFNALLRYYKSIGGDVVRVCTFGTETSKSAIQTACRGLKINGDVGLYLSSLIPVERGKVWSIHDCYYGNEDEGRKPITEFKNILDEYKDKKLLDVTLGIENLINKRSSHACGVVIVNEKFTNHNAFMRTPSGELVSQYELHDSEELSNLKYDLEN